MRGSYTLTNEGSIPTADSMERAVIGAILIERDALTRVLPIITDPEAFSNIFHERLYRMLVKMYDAGDAIDLYTVGRKVASDPELKSIGCKPSDVVGLSQSVGSASHVEHHAAAVMDAYIARKLAESCMLIASAACDESNDIADVLQDAGRKFDRINEMASGGTSAKTLKSVIARAMTDAENRSVRARAGETIGIPSGIPDLDEMLFGWHPGTLNIIAARPAMGKTALMLHFAKSAAKAGFPGCIYSLEMSDISIANRLILSECDVNAEKFRSGNLSQADWDKLNRAESELSSLQIYIDDNPVVSMRYVKSHSSIMHKKGNCEWIMIDYLQLADMGKSRDGNREQAVAQASREAKIIAKSLNIPVLLLSQLSRKVEERADKTPMLSDLRESGAIEQDADIVSFIHRPAYYKSVTPISSKKYGEITNFRNYGQFIVAKQRDGRTGTVHFLHNDSMTKIEGYSPARHSEIEFENTLDVKLNESAPF